MGNQPATDPAARGRIIRKGAGGTSPRRPAPVVVDTSHAPALRDTTTRPKRYRRIRDTILTFLGIPLVFAASAGFMWSRPLDRGQVASREAARGVHSRYHHIGAEMEGRFSATLEGVVVKREKRSDPLVARVSDMTASKQKLVATIDRSGDAAKTKSASELEALERQVYRVLKRHGKPVQNGKELAGAIVREALLQDYDPVFVAAVIKSESAFNSLARSHKGAQGLMQIMPKTGAWLADQHAIPRRKLTDPGHNLKLGISYLKQLEREYGGNRVLTLIAYNWGPGHVASASAGGRRVPGEVMQYAVKILNDYRRWSSELRSSVG